MLSFLNHPGFQPTHDTLQWSGKLQDTTPSQFAITGPACCRLSKQLPQGDQSNLVYSSLSIHTSDLAHVIMTFLLSTKSSHIPKKKKKKSTFDSAPWTLNRRITPSVYVQVFLRRASVDAVPVVGDPAQAAHPEHISHTNTHLSHLANPLHQSRTCSLPLNFQSCLARTSTISDLSLICSPTSAWATNNPPHQGQTLHGGWRWVKGGYPFEQHPASTVV